MRGKEGLFVTLPTKSLINKSLKKFNYLYYNWDQPTCLWSWFTFSVDIWEFWFLFFKSSSWSFKLLTMIKRISVASFNTTYTYTHNFFLGKYLIFYTTNHHFPNFVSCLLRDQLSADILHFCAEEVPFLFLIVLMLIPHFSLK